MTDCDAYASDNAGCQIRFEDDETFGPVRQVTANVCSLQLKPSYTPAGFQSSTRWSCRYTCKRYSGSLFGRAAQLPSQMARDGFIIWTFSRKDIPQDIEDEDPVPANWGKPKAVFGTSKCNLEEFFEEQSISQ